MLQRQTLTSQVIDYILDLIKSGQVKPGERLPTEKELTETLQVSRTCVREAMKSLESLHLVTVRPRVGAVVQEPSARALFNPKGLSTAAHMQASDELIQFRRIMETGLVALAAENASEEDLRAMEKALEEHKEALKSGTLAYQPDLAFHDAVAAAAKNAIAVMVLQTISEPLADERRRTARVPGASEAVLKDHRRIYRAIRDGDAQKARDAMVSHMNNVEKFWRLANQDGHGARTNGHRQTAKAVR